jgi:F-type H+-transporting ATPase subunit b
MWALAAETVAEQAADHGAEPFYVTAEFWVAVGFVLFMALVARSVLRVIGVALDDRADKIRSQIDEATRLAEEAQQLLATYERKQREAADEAETIVDQARREADRLARQAAADLERSLKRREELALERIAQAEQTAVADVRARMVEIAMAATRRLLVEQIDAKQASALIDSAIDELPKKLH